MNEIQTTHTGLSPIFNPSFDELTAFFIAGQNVSETSRKAYSWQLKEYFKWVQASGIPLCDIRYEDILSYKKTLQDQHHSNRTVASYLNVVRLFYRWAHLKGYAEDITQGMTIKTGTKKHSRMYLTSEQAKRLLYAAKSSSDSLRNYAMINLILYTGLRTIEVSRAKISDITYREDTRILKVRGKGKGEDNNEDFVVLIDEAYKPIKEYLDNERKHSLKDEPLFVTNGKGHSGKRISTRMIQMICKENLRAVNLDSAEFTAHSLRHTTAMQILNNGGNLYDVQRVLRHASLDTSRVYEESFRDIKHIMDSPEKMLAGIFSVEDTEIQ